MSFKYLENITLEEALKKGANGILDIKRKRETETIKTQDAFGRTLARHAYAKISSPHYCACAMDGIAVNSRKTFGATETTPVYLKEGEDFAAVDTGDVLPYGFDAVIMIEDVVEEKGMVRINQPVFPWQNVRQIGEDVCSGEMILPSNVCIDAASIGALLSAGVWEIEVFKNIRIALIPTGDEIVKAGTNPREGDIIDSNSSVFSSYLMQWGYEPIVYEIVPDDLERVSEAIRKGCEQCDAVIVNAGSSAGRGDYTSAAIESMGSLIFHGVSIKPGKPAMFGIVNDTPVFGVPGYPVSGIIVMKNIIRILLQCLQHKMNMNYYTEYIKGTLPSRYEIDKLLQKFICKCDCYNINNCDNKGNDHEYTLDAKLARKINSSLKYKEYVRVKVGYVNGQYVAVPLNRGAGVITSFLKADGILEVPQNVETLDAGENVNIAILKHPKRILSSLLVVGSHDVMLDEMSDIFNIYSLFDGNDVKISSIHVGSLPGIFALKRGESHICGIHLLDGQTGEYNISFANKYFPHREAVLIRGVKRIQGLIVQKGNPLGIKGIEDIMDKKLRYVNRQKGSGTRILYEFLTKNITKNQEILISHGREEYTHMAVASSIASGTADAGLGVYSAAKAYDLDFIPVCTEQYDFLVSKDIYNTFAAEKFLDILKSETFRQRLLQLGGYEFEGIGEVIEY